MMLPLLLPLPQKGASTTPKNAPAACSRSPIALEGLGEEGAAAHKREQMKRKREQEAGATTRKELKGFAS
jgi:hypothetical protein